MAIHAIGAEEPVFLGIEIGGTKLQLGLGDGDGRLLAIESRTVDPSRGASRIREQIIEILNSLLENTGLRRPVIAGIGFGGPVDSRQGRVVRSNHVEGWDGFELTAWARDALGLSLAVLQNDSDTAALGEAQAGAGRGVSPMLYINSGSGVGGGLILDGRIYQGAAGCGAFEIGHIWLDDTEAGVGGHTLESIASGWAIGRAGSEELALGRAARGTPLAALGRGPINGRQVADAAIAGDPLARDLITRAARAMGHAVAICVNLVVPQRVVLGGGVAQLPESLWRGPIEKTARERIYEPLRDQLQIVTAELGQDVVIHGALALARGAAEVAQDGGTHN